jgi:DNA repair protein RadC
MIIPISETEKTLNSPKEVYRLLQEVLSLESEEDRDKEHFWVLMLDVRQQLKTLDLVSIGILNSALVHPREVFRCAITQGCASIILAHNHPSGQPEPSADDLDITQRMEKAGEILGIEVLDHIIVASNGYYSFKEHDQM